MLNLDLDVIVREIPRIVKEKNRADKGESNMGALAKLTQAAPSYKRKGGRHLPEPTIAFL
jgi:hypothetical protein